MKSKLSPLLSASRLALCAGLSVGTACAGTNWWDDTPGTNWTDPLNWGGVAPLATDIAGFSLATYVNPPILTASTLIDGIQIGDGILATGDLTISHTGAGALTLGANGIDMKVNAGAATISAPITLGAAQIWQNASSNLLTIGGAVSGGNNLLTVGGAGNATITGAIGGTGGLTKSGAGMLTLSSISNSFAGGVGISGGTLAIGVASNLPTGNTVTLTGGGTLSLTSTSGMTLANTIVVAAGQSGTLKSFGNVNGNSTVQMTGNYSGVAGTLTLDATDCTNFGGFYVGSANGPAAGSVVSFLGSANTNNVQLGLNNSTNQAFFANTKLSVTATGSGTTYIALGNSSATNVQFGALDGGNGTTYVGFDNRTGSTITINGTINGNFSGGIINGFGSASGTNLVKAGNSTQTLSGANTYTGGTTISGGTLQIGAASNLNTGSAVTINNGATLSMTTGMILANNLTIAAGQMGTLKMADANVTLSGNYSGVAGTLVLDMSSCTSYRGFLPTATNGPGGIVSVIGGIGANNSQLGGAGTNFWANTVLTLPATGRVYMNGTTASWTFGALAGGNANTLIGFDNNSGKTITINGVADASFAGVIFNGAGSSGANNLVKTGTGTQILTSTNTYTGTTTVNGGKLIINGNISTSVLTTVNDTGTLGGSGTLGALTVTTGGVLSPGNSPGILTAGNTSLQSGSSLNIELNGVTVGTQYDQLNINGNVSLAGALSLTMGFSPANNTLLFILANDGVDAIVGTFSNAGTNGGTYNFGGQDFKISYFGNYTGGGGTFTGGNDVVLMAVPEPGAALLGGLGLLALLRRRRA